MSLTIADWLIVALLSVSTLLSLRKGFVEEALSLLTWVAAIVVARLFAQQLAVLLQPNIGPYLTQLGISESLLSVAILSASGFLLIVATLSVGGMVNQLLVGQLLGGFVKWAGLSSTDRFLGSCFGLARGLLMALVAVALLYQWPTVNESPWWQDSKLIPYFVGPVEQFGPILWEEVEDLLNEMGQAPA